MTRHGPETPQTSQAAERIRTADPFITREIEVPPSSPNQHGMGPADRREVTRTAGKDTPVDSKPTLRLTAPMRDLLWTVAQHKYGWTHVSRHRGQLQVADGLVRRGLVNWSEHHDRRWQSIIVATDAGRAAIADLWPVSPFVLGTYEDQPGGWDPRNSTPEQEAA